MQLLIKGNKKMGKEVYLFNLPPLLTCTPTNWCLHGRNENPACYALRSRFLWGNAVKGAKRRLETSKQDDFVEIMVKETNKKQIKYFRFHSSGDFYSQEYVRKAMDIAEQCPDTLFRTTTRRRDLTEILQELNSLPNFIVRESLDIERPEPGMGLPFAALSFLDIVKREEAYKCKNNCTACGHYCWEHPVNMYFDEN